MAASMRTEMDFSVSILRALVLSEDQDHFSFADIFLSAMFILYKKILIAKKFLTYNMLSCYNLNMNTDLNPQ